MGEVTPGPISMTAIAAAIIASDAPAGESTTPVVGNTTMAQPAGHQHPRLTSTTMATVATGTTAQVDFTRTFVNKPGVVCIEIEGDTSANAQPAIFKVQSWILDGSSRYTGCIVRVWRSQTIPTNLVSLLLGGVFNLFQTSVVGTTFSTIAVARSDV